jgi:hypothetical protein
MRESRNDFTDDANTPKLAALGPDSVGSRRSRWGQLQI